MINIYFKSNIDFSNDNEVIKMTNYQVLKKEGRILKTVVPINPIIDNWNGKDLTIQKTIWDGYYIDFFINESQTNLLSVIEACNDVIIEDTENNLKITVDTDISEYFIFEIGELLAQTSNYQVILRFRANKKVINMQDAVNNDYYLKIDSNYYYTDIEPIISTKEPEIETITSSNNINTTTSTNYQKIISILFYLEENEASNLTKEMSITDVADISVYNGTLYNVLENVSITPELLGNGLYKCVVNCVVYSDIYYNN